MKVKSPIFKKAQSFISFAMIFLFLSLATSSLLFNTEEHEFIAWMRQSNIIYTGDEYHLRLGIFISNQRYIREFNTNPENKFKLGLNHMSCMTPAEYRSILGTSVSAKDLIKGSQLASHKAEEAIDWREKGAVNDIKDQGQCGSCWAFSIVQAQESIYQINTGELMSLSESNLVDCVNTCGGCSGGWPTSAYEYLIHQQKGKFMLESDYPYVPVQNQCKFDESKAVSSMIDFEAGEPGDEDDMKNRISTKGPAAICLDSSQSTFHLYKSGIYSDSKCLFILLNHGVGIVGYGSENGEDYWILRNSWGKAWGEDGYMRIARNKHNMCGVATFHTYPIVK